MLRRNVGLGPYTRSPARFDHLATGVCEQNIPFAQALALQSSSKNGSPAPDLVL